MAVCILSEILSFLNLPQRSREYFPRGQSRPSSGIHPGLACAHRKIQPLGTGEKIASSFSQTIQSMRQRRIGPETPR